VYSASLAGAIALLFAHPRFGTLLRYSTVKLLPIIVTITILAIALVATRSQSAFIALSVGVILALAVKFPRKRILLLLLSLSAPILLLLSAFLFPSSFWNSLFGLRLSLFKDTLKLAFAHLPQGCSPSTFFAFFPPFASDFTLSHPYASDVIRSSESFYADAFASCGLLVLPLLAVGVLLLLRFYLNATEAQKTTTGLFASLYLPMLVTLFVLGFFDSSLSSLEVAYFAVLLLASTCGLTTLHTLPSIREEISSIRSAVKITLLVVAAYLFVAILCLLGFVHLKTAILTRHLDAAYSAKEARKVYLYADEIATFGQKEYQSVSALYKAASLALEEGNFPIAHFYLKTLLKTAPYFSATHYHLFRLYILTGNEKEGIEHLRLYLKTAVIPPRSWSFLAQLGEFLLSKNEVEFAAQVKERASRLHSSFKQNQK
ncbi:MAG: hypothetical protein N2234_04250, partial [Planctomycetota bacterium]|nr:hypothetical protein [Planctomycetota bacterium]